MDEGQPTQPAEGAPTAALTEDVISPEEFAKLSTRKVKRVIDGKEETISLADLDKGYGHTRAANKRFEEAAEIRKQVAADKQKLEQELNKLKDPKAVRQVLKEYLGEDGFSTLAHETVAEALRKELMTPAEIQAEEDRRELEGHRKSKKQQEEEVTKKAYEAQVEEHSNKLTLELQNLSKSIGRNIHPHEMDTLLNTIAKSLEQGVDLSIDEAWAYTHKTEKSRFERYLSEIDLNDLPAEFVEKVRKKSVEKLPFQGGKQAQQQAHVATKVETIAGSNYFDSIRAKAQRKG